MADATINGTAGERTQRKMLITVAEWGATGSTTGTREILGTRTPDSSIEFNADISTETDVRGITYTDVNKTEPQQSFDPFYQMAGSKLSAYLAKAAMENDIQAYNGKFTIYLINAGMGTSSAYYTVKHEGCTIVPTSMGGDSYVNMPIEVHMSNDITVGTVDKLSDDFEFTASTSV
uniref:Major tail protein n=1 Tax=Siphoviridae sp. ctsxw88 TaxID=2825701 RepID=A0A8S5PFV5_9CAUD|nr:MAG TPA: hypothetical protein [Siphoviridae sp. ctsxw88]